MDDLYNRVSRRRRSGQKGFTLIELLVVIALLAVLAAIVIFNVTGVVNNGKTAACQTDEGTVQTASDTYYADYGVYPTSFTTELRAPGADDHPHPTRGCQCDNLGHHRKQRHAGHELQVADQGTQTASSA